MTSPVLLLLLAVPAAGSLVLLLAPPSWGSKWVRPFAVAVAAVTLLLAALPLLDWRTPPPVAGPHLRAVVDLPWVDAIGLRFALGVDGISMPLVLLTAALVLLCMIYTWRVPPKAGRPRAFAGLVLLIEVGMLGTFLTTNLLLFFVFFEIVLLPMWFLIAVWGSDSAATRASRAETAQSAATRFVLYTLLGSAVMLVGFLLLGRAAGTFSIPQLYEAGPAIPRPVQLLAFALVGLGLAVKVPMWPLHTWLPPAHTAAPTVGSVLLAGVLLKMGTYGLIRIALPAAPQAAQAFAPYLGAFAVAGILYASLACLVQRDVKRLIAYSSVAHMGFVLLGIATLTPVGINGALFANVAHGLITGLLFFLVGAIKDRHGTADLDLLERGLYSRLPHLGGLLAFAAVASLGLPGLAGFWGEALALLGAYQPGPGLDPAYYRGLMVLAGLGTVLIAAYLLLLLRRLTQGQPEPASGPALRGDVTPHEWGTWAPLAVAIVLLGVAPGILLAAFGPDVALLLDAMGLLQGTAP